MTEATPSSPKPRRASILLILSLCLNIALVPVVAAIVVRALHHDTAIGSGGILSPRSVMATVPGEQASIQKIIDAHTPRLNALRLESWRARKQAFAVLAAPDYTPEKFAQALNRVRDADGALEGESIAMMARSLATLSPAERQAVVEKVRKRNRSWLFRMFAPRAARE